MVRGEVGVDHGCLDIGMTHQFPDGRKVYSLHHQMTGKGMPQSMKFGEIVKARRPRDLNQFFPEFGPDLPACLGIGEYKTALEFPVVALL